MSSGGECEFNLPNSSDAVSETLPPNLPLTAAVYLAKQAETGHRIIESACHVTTNDSIFYIGAADVLQHMPAGLDNIEQSFRQVQREYNNYVRRRHILTVEVELVSECFVFLHLLLS